MAFRESKHASIAGAGQTWYAPYGIDDGLGRITVRPTYYGMMFVNRALRGPGAQIFRAPLDGGWATLGNGTKTWGIANAQTGEVSVVIVHKDAAATAARNFAVAVPPAVGKAKGCGAAGTPVRAFVSRLECPGCAGAGGGNRELLRATHGLKLNGQTWDGSLDGMPIGAFVEDVVEVVNGVANVMVAPLTAVAVRLGCTGGMVARQFTPPTVVFNGPTATDANGTSTGPTTWDGRPATPGDPSSIDPASQQALQKPWYKHTGTIVGIAIAGLVLLLGIILLAFTIIRNRRRRADIPQSKLLAARARASMSSGAGRRSTGTNPQEVTMIGVEDEDLGGDGDDPGAVFARAHPHPFASRNPYLYRQGGEMV